MSGAWWLLGGALWVAHVGVLAARPEGCIGAGCEGGPQPRPTEDLLWLFLMSVCALGVGMLLAPAKERHAATARKAATVLVCAGAVVLTLGLVVNAVVIGDSPLWWLHDSDSMGRLLPVLGSVAAGVAALQGQWLGRWQGALLILCALASVGFNAQTDRILFTLPLGAAWVVVGASVLSGLRGGVDRLDPGRHRPQP